MRFQIGQKVLDEWDHYNFGSKMYKDASVGEVLDVADRDKQLWHFRRESGTGTRVREQYTVHETKYRIRWTNGPKAGKITWMKHLLDYDQMIEARQEKLANWAENFDNFTIETSKEQKI
jgi:hypothetical protein